MEPSSTPNPTMLSDWCKGVSYDPVDNFFGILVEGEYGHAAFGFGFDGVMPEKLNSNQKPSLAMNTDAKAVLILPIHLCKWETEE